MFYGGESNVPGAPGNLLGGGIPLRQLFPGAPSDIPFTPGMPGIVRPGTKQKLKDIFPHFPGGYGGEEGGPRYGTTPGGIAGNPAPHGKMYEQQPRDYLDQRMPNYPPGFGPQPQQGQPQIPQPGTPVQLELPFAMRGLQGPVPMGNAGALATSPQGPYTPLPAPGWNPGMIKPPGDPNFRPRSIMEKTGPTGAPIPWQAAGFQNKFVS
jgi:hypothetical protein